MWRRLWRVGFWWHKQQLIELVCLFLHSLIVGHAAIHCVGTVGV
jgi:hypothetical protein